MDDPQHAEKRSAPPPDSRIPWQQKLAYAVGGKAEYVVNSLTMGAMVMPVLNIGFGLSPVIIGICMMVFRVWDAISDPIMGNFSDNTRTRWGRRRPYIIAGGILGSLMIPLIYLANPGWSSWAVAVWFTVAGLFLYSAFTMWAMPYQSLGMEMTSDYDERTRLSAWCSMIGIPIALLGAWNFAFVSSPWFADATTGEPNLVSGARAATIIHALIFVTFAILPGIFVRERLYASQTSKQNKVPLLTSLKETLRTGPLWALAGVVFFNLVGLASIGSLGYYLNIYYVNAGGIADASIIEGWKQTGMTLLSIASIPFWTWFCGRTDKKIALYAVLALTFFGHSLNYFCLTPDNPWLQLIPALFYSAIGGSIWLIIPAMRMDVADYDELQTGKRREGSLASVFSWAVKMAGTLSIGLGGWTLQLTGFDAANKTQSPEILQNMFWLYLLLPIAFWSLSLLCLWRFPLNRRRMEEIRDALNIRTQ